MGVYILCFFEGGKYRSFCRFIRQTGGTDWAQWRREHVLRQPFADAAVSFAADFSIQQKRGARPIAQNVNTTEFPCRRRCLSAPKSFSASQPLTPYRCRGNLFNAFLAKKRSHPRLYDGARSISPNCGAFVWCRSEFFTIPANSETGPRNSRTLAPPGQGFRRCKRRKTAKPLSKRYRQLNYVLGAHCSGSRPAGRREKCTLQV